MDNKIKSIKIILLVLGAILLFSNLGGLLMSFLMFPLSNSKPTTAIDFLFANYRLICLCASIIGILCLSAGIVFNTKNKWSRIFVIIISTLSIICIIGFAIILLKASVADGLPLAISLGFLIAGLVFSSPFMILIIQLYKEEIKKYFT